MNAEKIRKDFPILSGGRRRIVYLDSAATSQKPRQVLEAVDRYYREANANPHRGVYELSQKATEAYEEAREKVARFINADSPREVVFVRNTTEAVNLVRYSWARRNVRRGERIVSTIMEHHSNLVPWMLEREEGAKLELIDIDEEGKLESGFAGKITRGTRLAAVTHASNVLGTINPVREIASVARDRGALTLVDGAQAAPHQKVDVRRLGCDFYAFSGHKMLAPMGIGVLWAKEELLEGMEPFLAGGDMIREVRVGGASWNDAPYKFEAGTPNVAGAVGLAAAIDYLERIGMESARAHERELCAYCLKRLGEFEGLAMYGPRKASERCGLVSFNLGDVHAHDLAQLLDDEGRVAVRSGHHCAQPLHERLGVAASARASFYVYNTKEDVDALCDGLRKAEGVFGLR